MWLENSSTPSCLTFLERAFKYRLQLLQVDDDSLAFASLILLAIVVK